MLLVLGLAVSPCWADASWEDGAVWYVDKANTSGTETGKSWGQAFTEIQPAIEAAHADGGGEVWVAKGTYDEARTLVQEDINTGALALKPGVAGYGGFSGNEKRLDQRDWEHSMTLISGERSRDGERAFHVVVGADKSRIDGFTMTGAHTSICASSAPGFHLLQRLCIPASTASRTS